MISRRNWLIGASAVLVSAPSLVRAASLMPIRGIVMSIQPNYYGFCDRLGIDLRYKSGVLRGQSLLQLIDQGVLNHIPRAQLAYDVARWGTAELSLNARRERATFFGYLPFGYRSIRWTSKFEKQFLGRLGNLNDRRNGSNRSI